jgi:hypothetical protein
MEKRMAYLLTMTSAKAHSLRVAMVLAKKPTAHKKRVLAHNLRYAKLVQKRSSER